MESPDPPAVAEISVGGHSYLLAVPDAATDYIQGRVFREGRPYEQEMLEDIAQRLAPGDTVLDVGANVGNHTLYLACVAGCQVYAFEPSAHLARTIALSAELNDCAAQVRVHQVAVGAVTGVGSLVLDDPANLGAQRVVIGGAGPEESIAVVTLDEMNFDGAVAALKVDVEGMEMDVLSGAAGLLALHHPLVYVECLDSDQLARVEAFLADLGYVWGAVFNASPTHLFLHSGELQDPAALRLLLRRRAFEEYSLRAAAAADRRSLTEANLRYRELSQRDHGEAAPEKHAEVEDEGNLTPSTVPAVEMDRLRSELSVTERLRVEQAASYDELLRQVRVLAAAARQSDVDVESRDRKLRVQAKETKRLNQRLVAERKIARKRLLASEATLARVEAELHEAKAALDEAARHRVQVKSDLRTVRAHIGEIHERLARAETDLETARADRDTLEETVALQKQKLSDHERRLTLLTKDNLGLGETLSASQKDKDALLSETKKVKAELKLRYSQVGAARRARDAFRLQLEVLTAEHHDLQARSAAELHGLQRRIADLDDAMAAESDSRLRAQKQLEELRKSDTYQMGIAVRNARSVKGLLKLAPSLKEIWKNRATDGEA